ncbi:MAG TPA: saccharopine dehydrogenase family protein [Alphaproteobacteria bacterium]|nr:saccharopine dehydrogenase family protein [Alphaproteobacteria bacterium]
MTKVMVVGGGKIGAAIVELLSGTGDYTLTLADQDADALARIPAAQAGTVQIEVADPKRLREAISGHDMVLSAAPYTLTPVIAEAARDAGAHYFDLTEDVESTRRVKELAEGAKTAFVPQCGLAPGFISIVAYDLAKRFDSLDRVHMRVGALPLYPSNALKYNLTWSTDGLINEYCNPCEAIHEGSLREILPLEGHEHISLDGIDYEAFNTSGGLGTLCETLDGRVRELNYKTVRYPGHRDIVSLLVNELRLSERRHILKDVLETAIPMTLQDVVLIFVTVSGMKNGRLMQETYAKKVYNREIGGKMWSAIQVTTASGICAMVDLMREGKLPSSGFVRQEQANLSDFLANRFGRNYA